MKFLVFLLFIQTAFAQVFVTDRSLTSMKFEGTLMSEGKSDKGVITVRESQGNQYIRIVNEVVDFRFPTDLEELEFNDVFMESQYFPQIRINGKLKEKINLLQDGIYIVNFTGSFTMRQQTVEDEFPVRIEIAGNKMNFSFRKSLELTKFYIPYAGPGSDIGEFAEYSFESDLKRTHLRSINSSL